ncbi:MAG: hypothetical protein LBE06_06905 [Azoarcus sp.]|nr:hypothetical protein [Azoarcus sp.]
MNKMLHNLGESLASRVIDLLPAAVRAKTYGQMSRVDQPLAKEYVFKLAQTKEELEACFRLLYREYVKADFMKPDSCGMRVMLHHALPTTSMLMCRYKERVVGTVSLIRESKLGFPMQRVFDLDEVFQVGGNVAEVSALVIDTDFRSLRSQILMPLLKFLYEYAEYRFDTRHLIIAVNPRHIGFYEEVLCFRRLPGGEVKHYDFVNGAPAVGAHLDLEKAKETFYQKYAHLPPEKNLYHYFTTASLPNGQFPHRRFHTTTDPVMTPELIDHFFNRRTAIFATLGRQEAQVLHAIYNLPEYKRYLPPLPAGTLRERGALREREREYDRAHRRFPVRCPARLRISRLGISHSVALTVYECAEQVFCAHAERPLAVGLSGEADVDLGEFERCTLPVEVVRLSKHSKRVVMLGLRSLDGDQGKLWLKFVRALSNAPTAADLEEATRFSNDDAR